MKLLVRINTKMVLIAALVVCVGFIASTQLIQRQVSQAMLEHELLSSQVISGFVVQGILPALKYRKPENVEQELSALAKHEGDNLLYAEVFDADQLPFANYHSDTSIRAEALSVMGNHQTKLAEGKLHNEVHRDYILMLVPVMNTKDQTNLGTLAIQWSLDGINEHISELGTNMLLVAITVVVLSIACIMWGMRLLVIKPINRISHLAHELAAGEGDLRRRIDYERDDELRELCDGINQFIAKVQSALAEVTQQTSSLTAIAQQSQEASSSANSTAQDQRHSLDQMAAATTELSTSIRNVASHASEGKANTSDALQVANEVQRIIEHNRQSIGELAAEVERAADVIKRVSDDSQQIGRILDVIQGIAEQTNLLALNAAIEAARAGEQGRGFAVVADEVRSLANKTQHSTEEIKTMIDRLQSGSQEAAKVMTAGQEKAKIGVDQAQQTREALQSIYDAVQRVSSVNSEIAQTTQDQAQAADSLSQDIVQLSDIGQNAAHSAERAAQVSNELSNLIDNVQATLTRFKV